VLPLFAKKLISILPLFAAGVGHSQVVDGPPVGISTTPQVVLSPPARTNLTLGGKKITIKYSSPSMRKRVIFGELVPFNQVWRAGANDATALHTDADLTIGNLKVPKGDYSVFVLPGPSQWQLIINKQTGQQGLEYHENMDLGRVPMTLSKPPKTIEHYKITLSKTGPAEGQLELAWENTVASVHFEISGS
jgi:hypothetical protein